jgi:hypothetical protein
MDTPYAPKSLSGQLADRGQKMEDLRVMLRVFLELVAGTIAFVVVFVGAMAGGKWIWSRLPQKQVSDYADGVAKLCQLFVGFAAAVGAIVEWYSLLRDYPVFCYVVLAMAVVAVGPPVAKLILMQGAEASKSSPDALARTVHVLTAQHRETVRLIQQEYDDAPDPTAKAAVMERLVEASRAMGNAMDRARKLLSDFSRPQPGYTTPRPTIEDADRVRLLFAEALAEHGGVIPVSSLGGFSADHVKGALKIISIHPGTGDVYRSVIRDCWGSIADILSDDDATLRKKKDSEISAAATDLDHSQNVLTRQSRRDNHRSNYLVQLSHLNYQILGHEWDAWMLANDIPQARSFRDIQRAADALFFPGNDIR